MKTLRNLLMVIGPAVLLFACDQSTKSEEPTETVPPAIITLPAIQTAIADNHPSQWAQTVRSNVESMGCYASMYQAFCMGSSGFNWNRSGIVYTCSVKSSGNTIQYKVTEQASACCYQFFVTGSLDGFAITNALWFEGTYHPDGTSGQWKVMKFTASDQSFPATRFAFTVGGTENSFILTLADSETDEAPNEYTSILAADGSGTADWLVDGKRYWFSAWQSDGSGTISYYDFTGAITGTHSWTANP